jgi:amidohydrolase
MGFISGVLRKCGFEVEEGYCGVATSFRAVKKGKEKGPVVAFLAEYDALRGIGHGCGHNVIATCSTGAFLGLASMMDELAGEVWLIGTPAEEEGAGKAVLLEKGAFDGVDFALMMHPTGGGEEYNYINRGGRASGTLTVSFRGKSAHSSNPALGVNALTAAISVFNQIDMLRPLFDAQDNVNGVILEGGTAGNVIPEFSKSEFCMRAETMKRVKELLQMVRECAERAASLTGAELLLTEEPIYAERYPCKPMCEAFKDNMASLGISMCYPKPGERFGSSDVGNVSIRIPAIHDYLSITDDLSIRSHSVQYAEAAATPQADEICLKGAKGLAMTGLDLLMREELRRECISYHESIVPDFYKGK